MHASAAGRAALASLLAGCAAAGAQSAPDEVRAAERMQIECSEASAAGAAVCRVDTSIYVGWRAFNMHCASCHAEDALGSSFAPNLPLRMRGMQEREFVAALDNGYLGPDDPSPPRGAMPDVARYYNELWSYLSARASDALPPGPLERLPNAVAVTPAVERAQ